MADHVGACRCGLVPSRVIIRQIDGHVAGMRALADSEWVVGRAGIIESPHGCVGSVPEGRPIKLLRLTL